MDDDDQINIDDFLPKKTVTHGVTFPKLREVKVDYLYFTDNFNNIQIDFESIGVRMQEI